MLENLKYWAKRTVRRTRLLLGLLFSSPNKSDWQARMLLVNLGAIGDLVVFTSVLKHYKRTFPNKKIFLLMSGVNGFNPTLLQEYVDDIILINPKKFNTDFRYGCRFVKRLRNIGFATVIEHNPHLEWAGKTIAAELGAEKVFGYAGIRIDIERPIPMGTGSRSLYIQNKILPHYTNVIPNIIERWKISANAKYLPHIINHHVRIFEYVSGTRQHDYTPRLAIKQNGLQKEVLNVLNKNGIQKGSYCLLSLTTGSTAGKEWEMEKFADVCDYLAGKNIPVVLVGTKSDAERKKGFLTLVRNPIVNLTGTTNIPDVALLIKDSLFTLSSETSLPHIAIALRKPCMVVAGAWNLGMWTFYGYSDINKWVYQKNAPCMGDNGQCIVDRNRPASCVSAIGPDEVKAEIDILLHYLSSETIYPKELFAMDFGE